MKHLLIAASVLAMTAGASSAQTSITFSGTAAAGVAKDANPLASYQSSNTPAYGSSTDVHAYSTFELDVAATGTTDSGLTFGLTDSLTGGTSYTLSDSDGFDTNGGTLGNPTIYVSGAYGKVSFSADNLDAYNTDVSWSGNGDVSYSGTFGGVSVGLVYNINSYTVSDQSGAAAVGDPAVTTGPFKGGQAAVMASAKLGGIALSADYNQDNAAGYKSIWDASAAYTMGAFTGTLSASNGNNDGAGGTYDTAETLKLAYASGGMGAYVQAKSSYAGHSVEYAVGGSYASGPISLNVDVADVTAVNHPKAEWTVTAGYDLGNGLALTAGANYTNDMMVGATMKF